jgi:hypothetical protein
VKTIEIVVDRQGRTKIETRGFTGSSCRDASKFVEEALGHAAGEQLRPEFYQTQEARQDLRQSS